MEVRDTMQGRFIPFAIQLGWLLASCGTTVDVGENEERAKTLQTNTTPFSADAEAAEEEIPNVGQPGSGLPDLGGTDSGDDNDLPDLGAGDDGSDDGTGTDEETGDDGDDDNGSGGGYTLTCFGPNPSLPSDVQTFCNDIPADLKNEFAAAHSLICEDKRLINLALYDVCSWHGDPADITKRRKVLAASDINDANIDWFYLLTAYSVTSHSSPAEHLELIRKEMTDPNFEDSFAQIRNSTVTDMVEYDPNHYSYHVSLANSAATVSFRAHLKFWRISEALTVVFDYAVSDKVILQDHKYLRLLVDVGEGQSRIVGLDEKKINDSGQHNVAYSNLIDIVQQRMEKDYENSLKD